MVCVRRKTYKYFINQLRYFTIIASNTLVASYSSRLGYYIILWIVRLTNYKNNQGKYDCRYVFKKNSNNYLSSV